MTPAVLLILLLIGVIAPLSQSASLGSGDGVNPSGVEELEQSSTTGLSPSPSPMLVEKKRTLSGTFEMQRVRERRERGREDNSVKEKPIAVSVLAVNLHTVSIQRNCSRL